jgi:hypothetical protein
MPEYISSWEGVAPEGDYPFTVDDAIEKESRRGSAMIELQLLIDYLGNQIRIYDHLVFTQNAFWKIDQFRLATGEKLVNGQKVNFEAEDCIGRKGRCHLIVDTFDGRTRNKVDSYLPPAVASTPLKPGTNPEKAAGVAVSLNELGEPDDIPF